MKIPIRIRKAIKEDADFIFNSWLKSYRKTHFAKPIHNTVYFENHHKLIERLFKTSEVLIACNSEDENQILGYMVAEVIDGVFVIHWMYTKHSFRRFGIARELAAAFNHTFDTLACYTHQTDTAAALAEKFNLIYHPYLLITDLSNEESEYSMRSKNVEDSSEEAK